MRPVSFVKMGKEKPKRPNMFGPIEAQYPYKSTGESKRLEIKRFLSRNAPMRKPSHEDKGRDQSEDVF